MSRVDGWYKEARKLFQKGDLRKAWEKVGQVLASRADHGEALHLAGLIQLAAGNAEQALAYLEKAAAHRPDKAGIQLDMGRAFFSLGAIPQAEAALERARSLNPDSADAYRQLAQVARRRHAYGREVEHLQHVVRLQPNSPADQNELGEALIRAGRAAEAVDCFAGAAKRMKKDADVHVRHAAALYVCNRAGEAEEALSLAARCGIGMGDACMRLGRELHGQYEYGAAAAAFERAIQADPNNAQAHFRLGIERMALHDYAGARMALETSLERQPEFDNARSTLLFSLCYDPDLSPAELLAIHRDQGDKLLASRTPRTGHANSPDPDRVIRVGYVSPDFRRHPVSAFIASALAAHRPDQVEVTCYASVEQPDGLTHALKGVVPHWRDIFRVPDGQVADQIQADRIDILVDLSGYTSGGRMGLFALKPAPVQVSYLGYPATSGLSTIDYRLTDMVCNPEGTEAFYTEKLVRLKSGFCCYMPPPDAPEPGALPASRNGFLTFGCLLNLNKVNPKVVALWAKVLKAVPDAKLAVYRHTLRARVNRERLLAWFAEHGIGPERLTFTWEAPEGGVYLLRYQEVDMVLDTLPFAGHTSTCEAAWMGVPVLTLKGREFAGRLSAGVNRLLDLDDFVADTEAGFVDLARTWAGKRDELAEIRAGLRARMAASSLVVPDRFTHSLEAAYRTMWQTWCAEKSK